MDLKAHIYPGMCFDMQSWCLSSLTAFCICARSFQEGQVEVSPKSLIAEQVCDQILDFWPGTGRGPGWSFVLGMGKA